MKVTDKQIKEALWNSGGFITHAAQQLHMAYSSISERIRKTPELQKELEVVRESHLDLAESKLIEAVNKGRPWAICFYLKCKGKHRGYIERQEVTGVEGGPLEIHYVNDWREKR
jgi:hypothetical protein